MSSPLRAKKKNNTIVWVLMGLLVISLTGFGVQSVGSGGRQAVASVGDQRVTVDAYVRALNTQLRALSQRFGTNITFEQARAFGIDRQVLETVLLSAALDAENQRIGLSVGDSHVRDALLATEAFKDLSGKFDQTAYEYALREANLKPGEYDEILRNDTARNLLRAAVGGGIDAGKAYPQAIMSFVGEARDFEWAFLDSAYLSEAVPDATEEDINAQYAATPEAYTKPEIRKITFAWITPEMLIPSIEVEDSALRALYDADIAKYSEPERRIAERLVFPDDATAQAALKAILSGEKTFEQVVAERGLELGDVDLGEVQQSDLSQAAGKAVFEMKEPGIIGPVQSAFGPALFRINAVLDARETSFEDAREELKAELVADRARRLIDDKINNVDDLLAGGATLEDVAAETALHLGTIEFSTAFEDGIAAYDEFRTIANAAKESDFPEVHTLEDGGIFALRLDAIVPPTLIPLAEVRDQVEDDWHDAETNRRVLAYGKSLEDLLNQGNSLGTLGIAASREKGLRRDAEIEGVPASLMAEVFAMADGASVTVADGGTIVIARLTGVTPYDPEAAENKEILDDVSARLAEQLGEELFDAFADAVQEQEGITINQNLIAQIQHQMTSGGR